MNKAEECTLLGICLIGAQKIEFVFYGLVAAVFAHTDEAKKDKRFRGLTPEKFFRGSVDDLKATLGQLEKIIGSKLLISSNDLDTFIKNRNLIVHNYWRLANKNDKSPEKLQNPETFLKEFIERCVYWKKIMSGLLWLCIEAAAKKENRLDEINFNNVQKSEIEAYRRHVQDNYKPHMGNKE